MFNSILTFPPMMIFFDIETVIDSQKVYEFFSEDDKEKELEFEWYKLPNIWLDRIQDKYENFDFMPEFHKILTIWCGTIKEDWSKYLKSLEWDEKKMIEEFFILTNKNWICWFNIKWFDIPFIVKMALYLWIPIPNHLKLFWKKHWNMENIIDLYSEYKHMWFKSWSLDCICKFLWIPTPKNWIDWSMVQRFHDEWKDQMIIDYCLADVSATIDVYTRFKDMNFI